jgi:3-phosphoshikimate 1-carboxyvinyltransferase
MKVLIRPKKLNGVIDVVPSKSYSHRAIIAASLAKGRSVVRNVLFSDDINRTISCCEAFGAIIEKHENYLIIDGSNVRRVKDIVNVGESGSTIRFMIPIMLTNSLPMEFVGENNLVNRPLDAYYKIFDEQGICYSHPSDKYLPLKTNGGLKSGEFSILGNISSQFITGLLFALPLLDGDSKINIIGNLESKAYIDLTLEILNEFGVFTIRTRNSFLSFLRICAKYICI